MASPSGASSGSSSMLQNSGSEEDLQHLMDQRKRKRMLSNRESARRSRMRKQKHLDDLVVEVGQLRKDNNQILTSMSVTTQLYINLDAENSVLRAQMAELNTRLQSLNDIIDTINSTSWLSQTDQDSQMMVFDGFMNPWNSIHANQPIMAAADHTFMCWSCLGFIGMVLNYQHGGLFKHVTKAEWEREREGKKKSTDY